MTTKTKKATKKKIGKEPKYVLRGVPVTTREYNAFVRYLNRHKVQKFTRADVSDFLKAYHTDPAFQRAYSSR